MKNMTGFLLLFFSHSFCIFNLGEEVIMMEYLFIFAKQGEDIEYEAIILNQELSLNLVLKAIIIATR